MNWEKCREIMERDVIKTDDMATDNPYFMATHMPFDNLEVYEGGQTDKPPKLMDETRIFQTLICNPENRHRMIIVRGSNGAGKSHLIRYWKTRLERSGADVYNPETEQLVFLLRRNNSVRGAFAQLLEQNVIRDPDIKEKMRKFVASSASRDEESFKTDIFYAYIAAVSGDRSGTVYKWPINRNIAQYLSDPRMMEHLMKRGGAIERCYRMITSPSNQILPESLVFTEEDFSDKDINKKIARSGNPDAQDFAETIHGEKEEIRKLVRYLNRFAREVVQRCADISSENAKAVFEHLRRDLKKQGKNLTLFIEDFTGFTGIDSELITILSIEHGGDYADLCRVTSVIGITDGYYNQFKDNFKDRVTHQINVTERSFGSDEFLVPMAARYLNAIYCAPEEIRNWYERGAVRGDWPVSAFQAPCPWEEIPIDGRAVTLYPFNRQALHKLYHDLPTQTPRMFLKDVLQAQLKEYFDGKQYGAEWAFPLNPKNVPMGNGPHSSAIDALQNLSPEERKRLKSLFAIWGDGSANGVQNADGGVSFGGLPKAFLDDIALSAFHGVGKIQPTPPKPKEEKDEPAPSPEPKEEKDKIEPPEKKREPTREELKKERECGRRKEDIEAWYSAGKTLQYSADYREWLREFLIGKGNQPGAINWQDSGVPAYIADRRLNLDAFYIDGQSGGTSKERALIVMEKSAESRDALIALTERHYAQGWDFPDSPLFYQRRLIAWLERNRESILKKVYADYANRPPLAEWGLALQYLKAMIYGKAVDVSSPLNAVKSLFTEIQRNQTAERITPEWNDLIRFVEQEAATFEDSLRLLQKASNTTMGAVQGAGNAKSVFRAEELLSAAEKLIQRGWDIADELPERVDNNALYRSVGTLKNLYQKIRTVTEAEEKRVCEMKARLSDVIGELSEARLIDTVNAAQTLFSAFRDSQIFGYRELRGKYEYVSPGDTAKRIINALSALDSATGKSAVQKLAAYSGAASKELHDFLQDMEEIEKAAETERVRAENGLNQTGQDPQLNALSTAAKEALAGLFDRLETMEAREC